MMNKKTLVTLGAVLVLLLTLVVLKSAKQDEIPLEQAVELHRFVSSDVAPADVAKIELFAGAAPDDKVILERDPDDASQWRVVTHYNAPAADAKVNDYLKLLIELRGEPRERDASDDGLSGYSLKADEAFHAVAYNAEGEVLFDVLVGKQADFQQVFARPADTNDVFVVDKNPRREAGLWSEEMADAPEAQPWLNKEVINVAQDTVNSLEIVNPLKRVSFRKETPPADAEQAADEDADADEEAPAEPEPVWTLAEGGYGSDFKQPGLDRLLRAIAPLNATDIVDNTTPEAWGLDQPAFTLTIGSTALDQPLVLEGGRPDPAGDGYVRIAGRENSPVYQLTKTSFEQLFAVGKALDLFDLPDVSVAENEIQRVEIIQPDAALDLQRQSDQTWAVAAPPASLDTLQTAITAVVSGLAHWSPADVVTSNIDTGLAAPSRTVRAHLADGTVRTIAFGADCTVLDGVYVQVDDLPEPVVMTRADADKILAAPRDVFQLTVFGVEESQIGAVSVQRPGVSYTLTRGEGGAWTLATADGAERPADESAVNALLTAIADLQALDLLVGPTELGEPVDSVVSVTTLTGVQHELQIGARGDATCRGLLAGKNVVFTLDNLDVADLLPSAEEIAPVAEAEVAEEPMESPADPAEPEQVPEEAPAQAPEADLTPEATE